MVLPHPAARLAEDHWWQVEPGESLSIEDKQDYISSKSLYMYVRWRHHMETLTALPARCEGNAPVLNRLTPQMASNGEIWCFLCCQLEQAAAQTVHLPMIWVAKIALWSHYNMSACRPNHINENMKLKSYNLICGYWYILRHCPFFLRSLATDHHMCSTEPSTKPI